MFIYETKEIYVDINGETAGPLEGVVVTNGEQGLKPAEVGQDIFLIGSEVGDTNVYAFSAEVAETSRGDE